MLRIAILRRTLANDRKFKQVQKYGETSASMDYFDKIPIINQLKKIELSMSEVKISYDDYREAKTWLGR